MATRINIRIIITYFILCLFTFQLIGCDNQPYCKPRVEYRRDIDRVGGDENDVATFIGECGLLINFKKFSTIEKVDPPKENLDDIQKTE